MASKMVVKSILALRVITVLVLAASVVVMATNNFKLSDSSKAYFSDIHGYRYVVAVAGVGFVYTLIQLPFAIYYAATDKRWIKNVCLPEFDFYGDQLVSWLLATGVGVGFGVTVELKRFLKPTFAAFAQLGAQEVDEAMSKTFKFFDRANIATGILLVGFATMAVTSVLTSIKMLEKRGFFR